MGNLLSQKKLSFHFSASSFLLQIFSQEHGNIVYKIGELPRHDALGLGFFFCWGRSLKVHIEIKRELFRVVEMHLTDPREYIIVLSEFQEFKDHKRIINCLLFLQNIAIQSTSVFFPFLLMWHKWRSSHKRFSMSGNDPTEGLALMAEIFLKTVKTVNHQQKNWQKFLCHWMLQPGWHLQPHSFNNSVWRFGALNSNSCGGCASPADAEILPQFAI